MLITIIPIQSFEQALLLMRQAHQADLFEFRLDYLSAIDLSLIAQLQQLADKPVLFTLRKSDQGGKYNGDEQSRLALIKKLITLNPDYLDIEHDVPVEFCQQLKAIAPQTKLIRSYHHFANTPQDLSPILEEMIDPIFFAYKIITFAQSVLDVFTVLNFVKRYSGAHRLIAHAMGELGVTSRILGKIMGNYFTYASVQTGIASPAARNDSVFNDGVLGLLTLDELVQVYHVPLLNKATAIYALIGDPVAHSVGHQFHNAEFIKHQQNAVYVKFQVENHELPDFFSAAKQLPIQGLSVTMPHKQAVLAFCNDFTEEVKAIGAANTLIKQSHGFLAANTDGDAVVQILPPDLKDKKIILLGAGGAASSILYSLVKAGAQVAVYNRTQEKLLELSKKYPISVFPLNEIKHADYDILINTIPDKFYSGAIPLLKNKIIMDANYQATPTRLIEAATAQGCVCINGYAMFYAQAQLQRQWWFKNDE